MNKKEVFVLASSGLAFAVIVAYVQRRYYVDTRDAPANSNKGDFKLGANLKLNLGVPDHLHHFASSDPLPREWEGHAVCYPLVPGENLQALRQGRKSIDPNQPIRDTIWLNDPPARKDI